MSCITQSANIHVQMMLTIRWSLFGLALLVSRPAYSTAALCDASKDMPEFYVPPASKVDPSPELSTVTQNMKPKPSQRSQQPFVTFKIERLSADSFNTKVATAHDDTTWIGASVYLGGVLVHMSQLVKIGVEP